jgi:hypothetical protein
MTVTGPKSLLPASILGVGAITPLGRDLQTIARKLGENAPSSASPLRVKDDHLSDPLIDRRMRRADRFAQMAALAANDAWRAAECACKGISKERVGLIVASGFGPHCRGFRFLDGMLDYGDPDALPTDFSHSVHGAAAAYITELLELRGPSLTITDFECGFEQAVLLAQCWLNQGSCDRVLLGVVEQVGEVLIHCASRMLVGDERFVPGEGAVFFALGPRDVDGIACLAATSEPLNLDLMILNFPAIAFPETRKPALAARRMTTFSSHFGQTPSSSAFQLLGGLLSLRGGRPLGLRIQPDSDAVGDFVPVDNAATFKPSCDPQATMLLLTKS